MSRKLLNMNMSVIFRLICVRHGETEANKEMRIQGHLDVPLNKRGEEQSRQAGLSLHSVAFTRAYTSDLMRAKVTCDNILKGNKYPVDRVITDVRIRERNFGSVEGMLVKEIFDNSNSSGSNKSILNYTPPGAESLQEVQQRLVGFFKEMCQSVYDRSKQNNKTINQDNIEDIENLEPAEEILFVSHGAALKQLYTHFKKTLQCENFPDSVDLTQISPNTAISEFVVKYSPRTYHLKCLRLHDAKHLENLQEE